jgi:hypothetical protein
VAEFAEIGHEHLAPSEAELLGGTWADSSYDSECGDYSYMRMFASNVLSPRCPYGRGNEQQGVSISDRLSASFRRVIGLLQQSMGPSLAHLKGNASIVRDIAEPIGLEVHSPQLPTL